MYLDGWREKIAFLIFSEMLNTFSECLNCNSVAKGKKMDQSWVVSSSNDMELTSNIILIKVGEDHLMALIIIAVLRIFKSCK
jgi:hypothetical protein